MPLCIYALLNCFFVVKALNVLFFLASKDQLKTVVSCHNNSQNLD